MKIQQSLVYILTGIFTTTAVCFVLESDDAQTSNAQHDVIDNICFARPFTTVHFLFLPKLFRGTNRDLLAKKEDRSCFRRWTDA